MSSIARVKAQDQGLVNKYSNISTPTYFDSDLGEDVPIPFTVQTGVIDIAVTNSSAQTFIDNGSNPGEESFFQGKSMGGRRLADRLGSNFTTYLRNLISQRDLEGGAYTGPLTVVVPATMVKVQIAQPNNVDALEFENVFGVNDVAPVSDSFAGGDATLNYYTTFTFFSPLTIKYESPDSTTGFRYITFTSHVDGN